MIDFDRTIVVNFKSSNLKIIKCYIKPTVCVVFKIDRSEPHVCKNLNQDNLSMLRQSGIYFLFGNSSKNDNKKYVYIGQSSFRKNGQGLLNRLLEHNRNSKNSYWNEAVVFTTTDNSFGLTEISYLENYFCSLAKKSSKSLLKNGNEPTLGNISKEQEHMLINLANEVKSLLEILGYNIFDSFKEKISNKSGDNKILTNRIETTFYLKRKNKIGELVNASMIIRSNKYVVLKNSILAKTIQKDISQNTKNLRSTAKIDINGKLLKDLSFKTPSAASNFQIGKPLV